ncbi:MAG: tetratricopeptide repeat protein, partial [Gemmataceae bacterium]|nr:tetratricopeptide repeat protein [Gemmataceae bacterium]
IVEEIARGGMGRVYAGQELCLGREVAIKTLLPGADAARFVTEARITARLPHPGIPPVHHLGRLADGTPWLAMKLGRGQPLAALLASCPSPSARVADLPRLLQIFEQIAQAVGFAHARGVIHRDLKPLNVMVGEFGEVQVMDWGLAKELRGSHPEGPVLDGSNTGAADSEEGGPGGTPPQIDAEHRTTAGTVLGTPGYMAPEQARGEPVDARADVFALGAILATILTGKAAFVETDVPATIAKAARADLRDVYERLDSCGADAGLIALCKRCLSARVEDRAVSGQVVAAEVAAYRASVEQRLRRAEMEAAQAEVRAVEQSRRRRQWRWAAAAVMLTLSAGLAGSLWQMQRAIFAEDTAKQNESLARKNEEQAERNAAEARSERDAKDRALVAERAAKEEAEQANRELWAGLDAMTSNIVGDSLSSQKDISSEQKQFLSEVLPLYRRLASKRGRDETTRRGVAAAAARVGMIQHRLGRAAEARAAFQQAGDEYAALASDFPAHPQHRADWARALHNFGVNLQALGRYEEADTAYTKARDLRRQLADASPEQFSFRVELAKSYQTLGFFRRVTGRPTEAENAYAAARDLLRQLADEFPKYPDFRADLALSHLGLGNVYSSTGRGKEAEASYSTACDLLDRLAAEFPHRTEFRADLATCQNNRGLLLTELGRLQEAEAAYQSALSLQNHLATQFPNRLEFRADWARSQNNLGQLLFSTGRVQEAKAAFTVACDLQRQLVAGFPQQPDLRNELAGTLVNLALVHERQGHLVAAKGLLEEGQPHHVAALKANPRHPTYRRFYRNHLNVLTTVHAGLLQHDEAIRIAGLRRDLGWNPAIDAYDAASFLCECIPIVTQSDQLDEVRRRQAGDMYADEAMKLLQHAVEKGFDDIQRLKSQPLFGPLHGRKDFHELLGRLARPPQ